MFENFEHISKYTDLLTFRVGKKMNKIYYQIVVAFLHTIVNVSAVHIRNCVLLLVDIIKVKMANVNLINVL